MKQDPEIIDAPGLFESIIIKSMSTECESITFCYYSQVTTLSLTDLSLY